MLSVFTDSTSRILYFIYQVLKSRSELYVYHLSHSESKELHIEYFAFLFLPDSQTHCNHGRYTSHLSANEFDSSNHAIS